MIELRNVVERALDALGASHRWESDDLLQVEVPAQHRHHFENRSRLRLAFALLLWEQGRDLELVAPGSSVLRSLEDALREQGAGVGVLYGGAFAVDDGLAGEWTQRMTVLLTDDQRVDARPTHTPLVRFVFEVHLAGPPPTTELVPVFWDPAGGGVLDDARAAGVSRGQWFEHAEVAGVLRHGANWPAMDKLAVGEKRALRSLRRKLAALQEFTSRARQHGLQSERDRILNDQRARLHEADSVQERREIQAEVDQRLRLLDAMGASSIECALLSRTLLVEGRQALSITYRHQRTGERLRIRPSLKHGKLLFDQCAHCQRPRFEYLIEGTAQGDGRLVCTNCGAACQHDTCGAVLRTTSRPVCSRCLAPAWCSEHTGACAICAERVCSTHWDSCTCCDRVACQDHTVREHQSGRTLCTEHAAKCSVDQGWRMASRLLACPVTAKRVAPENAVRLDGDLRALHPDAVLVSPGSGRRVAQDRAERCAADRVLHHPSDLELCEMTDRKYCKAHLGHVDEPRPMTVGNHRVRTSSRTGTKLDVSVVGICSISGAVELASDLATCPVTGNIFEPSLGIRLDRKLFHPDGVVSCSVFGTRMPKDQALQDAFVAGAYLHPGAATTCELTKRITATRTTRVVACCNRRVADSVSVPSVVSNRSVCSEHRVWCEDHQDWVLPSESVRCEITDRCSCIKHARESECGRVVVLDRAPYRLSNGKWGCTDHYGLCVAGQHPSRKGDLVACGTSGEMVCSNHGGNCDCHGVRHRHEDLVRIPYEPTRSYCVSGSVSCRNCSLRGPQGTGETCRYCESPSELEHASVETKGVYQRRIVPLMPWFRVRTRVVVTGTTAVTMFKVHTLLDGSRWYRAHANGAVYVWAGTDWDKL